MPTIPLCHVLCVLHTNYFRSFVWNFSHRLQRTTKVCRWNTNLEKSPHFFQWVRLRKKGKSNQQKEQKLFFLFFLFLRFPSINFSSLNSFPNSLLQCQQKMCVCCTYRKNMWAVLMEISENISSRSNRDEVKLFIYCYLLSGRENCLMNLPGRHCGSDESWECWDMKIVWFLRFLDGFGRVNTVTMKVKRERQRRVKCGKMSTIKFTEKFRQISISAFLFLLLHCMSKLYSFIVGCSLCRTTEDSCTRSHIVSSQDTWDMLHRWFWKHPSNFNE